MSIQFRTGPRLPFRVDPCRLRAPADIYAASLRPIVTTARDGLCNSPDYAYPNSKGTAVSRTSATYSDSNPPNGWPCTIAMSKGRSGSSNGHSTAAWCAPTNSTIVIPDYARIVSASSQSGGRPGIWL
jgi:hypothetical protein